MIVYANRLTVQGLDAESVVLKAIGGWLKEQLGTGLHPGQLTRDGEHRGYRGVQRSMLRIHSCYDGEPALCSWVLKHADDDVRGRQWTVEVGLKKSTETLDVTCVVKTDEQHTLVSNPVSASQPRVIRYIVNNVQTSSDAAFTDVLPGEQLKTLGPDWRSYEAFRFEVERGDRDGAIVIVSATEDGDYLVNPAALQPMLVGLADLVQVHPRSDRFEMAKILGSSWSAWGGALNVLSIPSVSGTVRYRYFLADEIRSWGDDSKRVSETLARVTVNTNVPRLRMHVQPEGVRLLSRRRRSEEVRLASARMSDEQLRQALQSQEDEYDRDFDDLAKENADLRDELQRINDDLVDATDEIRRKDYRIRTLTNESQSSKDDNSAYFNIESLLELASRRGDLRPLECIQIVEQVYDERCTVLDSARRSARDSKFAHGRVLLNLLLRLVTSYRDTLIRCGDHEARRVFGQNEFAAKESDTVMSSKVLSGYRTFDYQGTQVKMFRHLKYGVADDTTRTIRVHFHWDGDQEKIVIGHCGKHLPVTSS